MPGPVPKRSDQRRRRNKPEGPSVVQAPGAKSVKPPAEDRSWHVTAKRWYRSLKQSGQSVFYEPSDWAEAHLTAELLSLEMQREAGPRSTMLAELFSRMDNLLTSEGARRRVRIELTRQDAGDDEQHQATVSILSHYKDELLG